VAIETKRPAVVMRGRYTDGVLHSEDDTPALTGFRDCAAIWCKRGTLHRDNDMPAVVYRYSPLYSHSLWFVNGVAHSPASIGATPIGADYRPLLFDNKAGSVYMLWKGMIACVDTLQCERPPGEVWVRHTKACTKRQRFRCRHLAEFGPHDTVRYDKYGLISCEDGPAVVRDGIKERWLRGSRYLNIERYDTMLERLKSKDLVNSCVWDQYASYWRLTQYVFQGA
jgi:hypothetical protein